MIRSTDCTIPDNMTYKYLDAAAIARVMFSNGRIRKRLFGEFSVCL
jgi:hypothetical protein